MQPNDVILGLADLFPKQRDELKGRASVYKQVLTPFAGEKLTKAYNATLAKWTKGIAPWPKEIADNAPEHLAGKDTRAEDSERIYDLQYKLVDASLRSAKLRIDDASSRHGVQEGDVRGGLTYWLKRQALDLAKLHVLRGADLPERIQIPDERIMEAIDGSQRAEVHAGKFSRSSGTFKHLRAPAVEPSPAMEGHELGDSRTVTAETVQE